MKYLQLFLLFFLVNVSYANNIEKCKKEIAVGVVIPTGKQLANVYDIGGTIELRYRLFRYKSILVKPICNFTYMSNQLTKKSHASSYEERKGNIIVIRSGTTTHSSSYYYSDQNNEFLYFFSLGFNFQYDFIKLEEVNCYVSSTVYASYYIDESKKKDHSSYSTSSSKYYQLTDLMPTGDLRLGLAYKKISFEMTYRFNYSKPKLNDDSKIAVNRPMGNYNLNKTENKLFNLSMLTFTLGYRF